MNRAERRKLDRDGRQWGGANRSAQLRKDGEMLRRKRETLRRQHGNPLERREALIEWVVGVNMRRGGTLVEE